MGKGKLMENHQYVFAIGEPSNYLEKLGVDTNKETKVMYTPNQPALTLPFDVKAYNSAIEALSRLGKTELEVILNFDIEEILKEKQ